jgi:membrane protein involved in colicin uptake
MNPIRAVIAVMFVVMLGIFYFSAIGTDTKLEAIPKHQSPYEHKLERYKAKLAEEKEAARIAAEQEAARLAAEKEAAQRASLEAQRVRAQSSAATPSQPRPAVSGDILDRLAQCESGMTNANTGNGYYGYFQFLPSTWRSMGESGLPIDHPYEVQKAAAGRLIERSGWGQFPGCARKLGMR